MSTDTSSLGEISELHGANADESLIKGQLRAAKWIETTTSVFYTWSKFQIVNLT